MEGAYSVTTEFTNARAIPCIFVLEPYGEIYEMPPASTLKLVVQGPRDDTLLVEYADDANTVYIWPGSTTTSLALNGALL